MVTKQKILVTGANGQLAMEIRELSASLPVFEFIFLSRADLAIENEAMLAEAFRKYSPNYVVNCAAYTAVDKAETERDLAFAINASAPASMATLCAKYASRFIHISTDYVFDGEASVPYLPESATNPQSVYGASKLEGERAVLKNDPDAIIIRTAWVYSEFGKNFVKTMMRLMSEKESINVVDDQVGSPTYAGDLAAAILRIISSGTWIPGIYHYSNSGVISWYEFAEAIREILGSGCRVNPIPSVQYPTPAKRPAYSVLETGKISDSFAVEIKPWRMSLEFCIQQLGL